MRVGLLLCDDVRPELQPEHSNYPEMFEALLKRQSDSIELVTYRVLDEELPATTSECDYWLISGSRHGVNDGYFWIGLLEDFVRRLYAEQRKLVGICFGHQVMATALGGAVVKSGKGWGVGLSKNTITQQKQWMQPTPPRSEQQFRLLVSHQDQVSTLPDSAEVVAGSDFCPFYMVQYGDHFLSIQGHPEFTKPYAVALMNCRRESIGVDVIQQGVDSLAEDPDSDLICHWIVRFFQQTP
ncbi:glutamine amidotransferase-related protein [Endozoicomonadaceae bacterium StTr2]